MDFRNMRQRVTFQSLPWVDDGWGGNASAETDWDDLLTTWGDLFPYTQGNERERNGKLEMVLEYRLRIRYRKGFDPKAKYRVKCDGQTFNVIWFRDMNAEKKVLEFRLQEVK